jgi:hypothetical protein
LNPKFTVVFTVMPKKEFGRRGNAALPKFDENSPALQRWVYGANPILSPGGTKERLCRPWRDFENSGAGRPSTKVLGYVQRIRMGF